MVNEWLFFIMHSERGPIRWNKKNHRFIKKRKVFEKKKKENEALVSFETPRFSLFSLFFFSLYFSSVGLFFDCLGFVFFSFPLSS